jgi:cytochrome c oxidase subunit 6c
MSALAKPKMRGYLTKGIQKHLMLGFAFSMFNCTAWYFGVIKPRKEAYRNFYATYDPDKDFERMRKAGVFMGIPKEEEAEEE